MVYIDARTNILYNSFYINGLLDVFGPNEIVFDIDRFKDLDYKNLNFIVNGKKYSIQTNDTYVINKSEYEWSDVYGCVNANFSKTPDKFQGKLIALCPSFGIRCFTFEKTITVAIYNALLGLKVYGIKDFIYWRKFFGKYRRMSNRPKLQDYSRMSESDNDYVFFVSTLWYNDEWNKNDETVNLSRAHFIRSCKNMNNIVFEGGLVSQGVERSSEDKFADCLCKSVSANRYMMNIKRSAFVFNTPAFWGCHGWKLGEFLSLGKAILSTPLNNDLPASLIHGKHIHFVDNCAEAINDGVKYLRDNEDYRRSLERNAYEYWNRYGTPIASLRLLNVL